MRMSKLELSRLRPLRNVRKRFPNGMVFDLYVYCDESLVYKFWSREYSVNLPNSVGRNFVAYEGPTLLGFDLGVYDATNCPALIDFLYSEDEVVVGYITRRGTHLAQYTDDATLERVDFGRFLEDLWFRCLKVGWVPVDVCHNNIIETDGRISLIDYDGHFTRLDSIDLEFEREWGVLRRHVFPFWRGCVYAHALTLKMERVGHEAAQQ